jgi:metal-responsive CopG/Arc/MetJ family transcriptional regulator
MHKVMFSLPDNLVSRMKSVIPDGDRSRLVANLLEREVEQREQHLYEQAMQLESNMELRTEMQAIDKEFMNDGLDNV